MTNGQTLHEKLHIFSYIFFHLFNVNNNCMAVTVCTESASCLSSIAVVGFLSFACFFVCSLARWFVWLLACLLACCLIQRQHERTNGREWMDGWIDVHTDNTTRQGLNFMMAIARSIQKSTQTSHESRFSATNLFSKLHMPFHIYKRSVYSQNFHKNIPSMRWFFFS